jgi:glutamate dehydrogenase/leucine dehydrogenase
MDGISTVTPWVTGVSESAGGSGDPSPVTAVGVRAAMRAAAQERWGAESLRDRRIVVQGAGKVGSALATLLVADGARVAVADVDPGRVEALVSTLGVEAVDPEVAVVEPCEVLAPCALGGVIDEDTLPRLRCEIVCGGANNQLATDAMDGGLAARGILYAPDFVANAGGILNIAEEFTGYSRERALAAAERVGETITHVFALAREQRVAPAEAAESMARERLRTDAVPGGRWAPGDPAAWTNGAPLTRLRPRP